MSPSFSPMLSACLEGLVLLSAGASSLEVALRFGPHLAHADQAPTSMPSLNPALTLFQREETIKQECCN